METTSTFTFGKCIKRKLSSHCFTVLIFQVSGVENFDNLVNIKTKRNEAHITDYFLPEMDFIANVLF